MRRLYTRSGDKGTTSIHGGKRVPKTDLRIEANGSLDELNVVIGMVRTLLPVDHEWQVGLRDIQLSLMSAMSLVATESMDRNNNPNSLSDNLVDCAERLIDDVCCRIGDAKYFILPGGTPLAAWLHQARVTARRAERRLWQLNDVDTVPENILQWVNRLSDLFFAMARCSMIESGVDEERWQSFSYNRVRK